MSIITISRGTYTGGEHLAGLLEQQLGYHKLSREELWDVVHQRYGYSFDELVELLDRAPSRFDHAGERRRRLFVAVQAALCDLVRSDEVVYHGNVAHLLLPGISHVLRVRLIAPRLRRIEMAMQRQSIDRFEATRLLDRVDSERVRWTQFVFGVNWADPLLYDVVLNLDQMTIDEAAEVVARAVAQPTFSTTEASRQAMADLALTSAVRAKLITNPATEGLELRVEVEQGEIKLTGLINEREIEGVVQLVKQVDGVRSVDTDGATRRSKR